MTLMVRKERRLPASLEALRRTWDEDIRPGARDLVALKRIHRDLQRFLLSPESADADGMEARVRALQGDVKGVLLRPEPLSGDRHAALSRRFAELAGASAAEAAPPVELTESQVLKLAETQVVPPPVPAPEPAPAPAPASPGRKRLFLVEDDGNLAQVLPIALQRYGYDVEPFGRLEPMLSALEAGTPSAIVVDVVLPASGGSGARMLQANVPIFFLSARGDLATRIEALRSGAEVYFANPLDVQALGRKLEAATTPPVDAPYRVLVVANDFGLALRHSLNLECAGLATEAIADPAETLPRFREYDPDAVLIDLAEGLCTGPELAAVLREEEETSTVPILLLSSELPAGAPPAAFGDAVLPRDVDEARLASAVLSAAKRHRVAAAAETPSGPAEPEPAAGPSPVEYARQTRRLQAIEFELARARDKQRQMLPALPQLDGYSFRALYEPCSEISGDFYDFIDLGEGRIGITIADVTGHGVTAALLMAMSKKVLHLAARSTATPAETLIRANREICGEVDRTTFVTILYGVLDSRKRTFRFARAGHEPLLLFNPGRETPLTSYQPNGIAMGLKAGRIFESTLKEVEIPLVPGDLFFLYTDGLVEATDAAGQEFGRERLEQVLLSRPSWVPDALVEHLYGKVMSLRPGHPLADDLTLLSFQAR